MSKEEQTSYAYAMAVALLSGSLRDGMIEEICKFNQFSLEDSQAIKKHVEGIIDFLKSMVEHALRVEENVPLPFDPDDYPVV